MGRRQAQPIEKIIGGIILAILLLAVLGVWICGKTHAPPPERPTAADIRRQAVLLVIEEEDALHRAMNSLSGNDDGWLDYLYEYSCVQKLTMPEDGLWKFELDSTQGSALGGCYYDLFYCKEDPIDRIYDWFGNRSGLWEDKDGGRLYRHKGNEIYLEALGNDFWFGYCYC